MGKLTFDHDASVGADDGEIIDVTQNAAVKNDPLMLNATLKDLKSAAAFKDTGVLDERHDHDRSVSGTPDADVIFEREAIGANDDVDVIDIPARPEFDALVAATGGPEKLKENAEALREVVALSGMSYDELAEGLTAEEEKSQIVSSLAEWREILGNPMRAQAMLQKIYSHPMQEPWKSYFTGRGSPALNDAIAKLWQATTGEPITGRPRSKGDGWIK
jgi:hypothetical protein